ncbi:MAG: TM2 domain-containing protein [Bacteroidota bacterium]
MRYKNFLVVIFFFFLHTASASDSVFTCYDTIIIETDSYAENSLEISSGKRPNPILKLFRDKQKKKKQVIAALLAFPLPFGIVGLHRIYLGCAPYVPVAYIASLGGMFGVLPLIDFCVLLLNKDTDSYSNNKKIFMWVN